MKRIESNRDIHYKSNFGQLFGDDISMCTRNNLSLCFIYNDGTHSYECHPEYKSSLFVNTAGPEERNFFSVLDYEVYTH